MTEYVVDFGDSTSSAFVGLAMAEAASHGAEMREKIVRCRDCKHCDVWDVSSIYGDHGHDVFQCDAAWGSLVRPDGFCAWGERRDA